MPLRRADLDPLPELARMRAEAPVTRLRRVFGFDVWLVTGHEAARAVLNDSVNYSTDIRALLGNETDEPIGGLGFTDPPDHTRLRRFLTPEFTTRRLAALQPRITEIVAERLDHLAASGPTVDLVSDFAFPIPFLVICELLGLPVADRERFRHLGHARFDVNGGGAGTLGAITRSREFLLEEIARQRRTPGDGLLGSIIRDHGDAVDDDELAGLADGVFTGGYETSASMLALGTLALLRDRPTFDLIRTDDSAIDPVIDELLRYLSVVQIAFPRFARHDLELFDQPIKAGDVVVVSLSAANRDESVVGMMPDRFDPSRPAKPHLAFGHGFHRCVGSELARMELRSAFQGLVRRFPDLTLDVEASQLQFRDLSIVFGVHSLPVRLERVG